MKMFKVLILLASLGVLFLVLVRGQDNQDVYCGKRLAMTLALLCENGMLAKRSESPHYNALMMSHEKYSWPWIPSYRAKSLERGKRFDGISSECCEKPCSMNELTSYCA